MGAFFNACKARFIAGWTAPERIDLNAPVRCWPARRLDLVFFVVLLAFCLLTALTQEVNCFPDDGWFQSQHRILGRWPGADNYTPIAAPAFFYALNHRVATLLSLPLVQEFYLGSLLQACMLFGALLFIFKALRRLAVSWALACAVVSGTAAYLGSTLLTQAFWSENAMVFLMAATTFLCARLMGGASSPDQRPASATHGTVLALALVLSLAVVTRVVPFILILPVAVLWLYRHGAGSALRALSVILTGMVLVVVLAMAANSYRFDRLELSNSTGRHLWQSIYPMAPQMLHDHPAYPALLAAYPELQKQDWWSIVPQRIPGYEHASQEAFLRELSLWAVKKHPGPWLRFGAQKFLGTLLKPLPRIGLWWRVDPATNPLARTQPLPPLLKDLSGPWRALLDLLHRAFSTVHAAFVLVPLFVGAVALGLRRYALQAGRATGKAKGAPALTQRAIPASLVALCFFSFSFLSCVYLSLQVEVALDRYTIPYVPFLAMMVATAAQLVVCAVRSATGPRRAVRNGPDALTR